MVIHPEHKRPVLPLLIRFDLSLQLIRNQQVSGSSPLAGFNLAFIKRAASDPIVNCRCSLVALSHETLCLKKSWLLGILVPDGHEGTVSLPSCQLVTALGCGTRRAEERARALWQSE